MLHHLLSIHEVEAVLSGREPGGPLWGQLSSVHGPDRALFTENYSESAWLLTLHWSQYGTGMASAAAQSEPLDPGTAAKNSSRVTSNRES